MRKRSLAGTGRARRDATVLAAALAAALAGAGPAAAVARPGTAGAPRGTPGAGVISTVAGGVGGPAKATKVALRSPCGVGTGAGHLYIADSLSVRKVDPSTDRLTTPAGTGAFGPLGDGGPATSASVNACGASVDHSGNLVIADSGNGRVRVAAASTGTFYGQAMTAGHIYTVAGNGKDGFSGDGGPAISAKLSNPVEVAVDAAGNLLIADEANNRVRAVAVSTGTFYGRAMTAGHIYTIAGNGANGFSGDGGPATSAELDFPLGVALDAAGNLVIADTGNNRARVVAVTAGTFYGVKMTAGNIYTVAGSGTGGFLGDGGPAISAELNSPQGAAVDAAGNLVIADSLNSRIRVVAAGSGTFYGQPMTAGDIYTVAGNGGLGFAGDGGPATSAELAAPRGVAAGAGGNLLILDSGNLRVRVVATKTGHFYGQSMTANHIYTVAGNGNREFSGDGGPATRANLSSPGGVAVDGAGNTVIADSGNLRIRAVAASSGSFYGQAMTAGDIYTVAGSGGFGFAGDGGPATRARFRSPDTVALDSAGNLLIVDGLSERIRVVAAKTGTFYGRAMTAGDIYTVAGNGRAGFAGDGGPATRAELQVDIAGAVASDAAGNLLIADSGNYRVRVVAARTGTFYGQAMTAGHIYTVAGTGTPAFSGDGGPATSAELNAPEAVAVNAAGNVLIADFYNARVRVVAARTGTFYGQAMTAGDIYTVAGDGTAGFSGDGGPATGAKLFFPDGIAADSAGNLVIVDSGNERIRVVAAGTGTFYGISMTAGNIYTVAGNGPLGFAGDGGPATSAGIAPSGVAVGSAGNLLIADAGSDRIRMVTG